MTNLDSILKGRDMTFPTEVRLVKLRFLQRSCVDVRAGPYRAEPRRTDACELWCWRRLLRFPWTARRSSQSILKDISPEWIFIHWKAWCCWSWNSNTLATWCEERTHLKRPWCWERLRAGGEGDNTGWDGWMASPTLWTWVWASSRSWWWTGKPGVLQSLGSQRVGHNWVNEQLTYVNNGFPFRFLGTWSNLGKLMRQLTLSLCHSTVSPPP